MSIRQLPSPRWTVPGASGAVAAGYYVYVYQPGTTTPKSTYTDYTGAVANTNPIVLDSRGEANIWWDGVSKVLVYTGDKDNGGALVWSQDNYGEGTTSVLQGNFNLVLNGSFEQDTNGDGVPDNWTVVEYTGGTVELDTTTQAHGSQSLKFTSVGTGGGYATSDFFEVGGSKVVPVSFAILASVATVHNQVDIIWHTAAQAVISTTTLYDDTATNPTSWTDKSYSTTAPATARYAKVRLFGCVDDDAQAGSTWFDNVKIEDIAQAWFPNVSAAVTASDDELNYSVGVTSSIQTQLDARTTGVESGLFWLRGKVNSDGTISFGTGFTVNRTAAGTYKITPSTTTADIVATASAYDSRVSASVQGAATYFYVFTNDESTSPTLGDRTFSFLALCLPA